MWAAVPDSVLSSSTPQVGWAGGAEGSSLSSVDRFRGSLRDLQPGPGARVSGARLTLQQALTRGWEPLGDGA